MLKSLERISTEVRFSNPWWDYCLDRYRMPNGEEGEYHFVHSRGSTMIIPQLENKFFVLLRQYRYLNGRESIEFPGGGVSRDISPEENARKELQEEANFAAGLLHFIGQFNPFNGVTNEICSVYLAQSLVSVFSMPDDSEEFETLILSAGDINRMIRSGEIWDGATICAWFQFTLSEFYNDSL